MSYQSVKLATIPAPALYYRLDMVGAATDGDSIPDLSGNDLHGMLSRTGGIDPYGYPSPIETDPASREFFGNNDVFPFVFNRILRASDSLIEPSGDFTLEGWLRPQPPGASHSPQMYFGKGTGNPFLTNCFFIGTNFTSSRFVGGAWDSAGTLWTVTDTLVGGTTDALLNGTSHYVVLVRLGNALAVYVDGRLGGTTTITSGLPTLVNSDPFFIHCPQTSPMQAGYDEVAFTTDALSGPQILTQYEAALNTLHSSATITVRVPVTLDTDSIEPLDFPFTHNWADPISGSERVITEHLSWKTLNNRSEPDYQQRIGARSYGPLRQLEYAITPTTPRARTALQRTLWQPAQFHKLPIATDWVELTTQANPSDTAIDCDTTLRDFEIGSYITVWRDVYDPTSAQTFRITSVSDTQLGVSPAVATTFPVGSQLMPARLAYLLDEESGFDSYAIDLETGALRFEILSTELSTRRVTGYTPATTHESIEVFSLDSARFDILDQTQYRIQRRQLGTGLLTGNDYYRTVDTLAPVTIPVRVLLVSRETLSEFYGWLEARQGKRNPVWVASAESDLELVEQLSSTSIKTIGYADYNLHYGRRHIQLVYTDGSVANRKITAMTDNGNGTETLTVATLPGGTIVKISLLRLCMAPDSFELRFHRDLAVKGGMIVECAWEFSELLTTP